MPFEALVKKGFAVSRILWSDDAVQHSQNDNHLSVRHTRVFDRNEQPMHAFLSCFWWGLPVMYIAMHNRALLPHVFTFTLRSFTRSRAVIFCGTFHELTLSYVVMRFFLTYFSVGTMFIRSPDFPHVNLNLRAIVLHTPNIYYQRETYCYK